jgi:hypothetical protein
MPEKHPVYVGPICKTRIPFGTLKNPPPGKCPAGGRKLGIPIVMTPEDLTQFGIPKKTDPPW